jgi:hypothetical protein
MASGYIAGGSLAGVLIAFLEFAPEFREKVIDQTERVQGTWLDAPAPAIACFAGLIGILALVGLGKFLAPPPEDGQASDQGPGPPGAVAARSARTQSRAPNTRSQ